MNVRGLLSNSEWFVYLVESLKRTSIENQTQKTKSHGDGLKGASIMHALVILMPKRGYSLRDA